MKGCPNKSVALDAGPMLPFPHSLPYELIPHPLGLMPSFPPPLTDPHRTHPFPNPNGGLPFPRIRWRIYPHLLSPDRRVLHWRRGRAVEVGRPISGRGLHRRRASKGGRRARREATTTSALVAALESMGNAGMEGNKREDLGVFWSFCFHLGMCVLN